MIQTESSRCRNPPKVSIFKAKANLARHKKGIFFFLENSYFKSWLWTEEGDVPILDLIWPNNTPQTVVFDLRLVQLQRHLKIFLFFSAKWLMWVCILSYLLFYGYPSPSLQKRVTPVTHPKSYYGVPKKGVSVLGWRNLIILCWC